MINAIINTENKTIIIKQDFTISELIELLKELNIWDYKITVEKEIIISDVNPSPWIYRWWEVQDIHHPIMY